MCKFCLNAPNFADFICNRYLVHYISDLKYYFICAEICVILGTYLVDKPEKYY